MERDTDSREARDDRTLKIAIGAFAGLLLICITISIHLSTLDLSFGSLVYGSRTIWRGHTASFRVAAVNPRGMQLLPIERVHLTLRDGRGVRAEAEAAGEGALDLMLRTPDDLDTHCFLDVELTSSLGPDMATLALRAVDTPGPMTGRLAATKDLLAAKQPKQTGSYRIEPYIVGGHAVSGFENRITGRLLQNGQPLSTKVAAPLLGLKVQSDRLGLFAFKYRPLPRQGSLAFEVGEAPSITKELPIDIRNTGMQIAVRPSGFIPPGLSVDVTLQTLPFRSPVHVDVWAGNALLLTTSQPPEGRQLVLEIGLPKDLDGPVRIDAYRNFVAPEDTRVSSLLWASPKAGPTRARDAREMLAGLTGTHGEIGILAAARLAQGDDLTRLVTLGLRRFVPETAGLPLMRSTMGSRQEAINLEKSELRAKMHIMFILTLLLGVGLAGAWVVRHQVGVSRAITDVIDDGLAAGDAVDSDNRQLTRVRHMYDLLLLLGALFLAAYGIFALITNIRWE